MILCNHVALSFHTSQMNCISMCVYTHKLLIQGLIRSVGILLSSLHCREGLWLSDVYLTLHHVTYGGETLRL